jgi:hypothetical protein
MLTLESDCDAPEWPVIPWNPQTICNYTSFFYSVKSLQQLFCPFSSAPWTLCKTPNIPLGALLVTGSLFTPWWLRLLSLSWFQASAIAL